MKIRVYCNIVKGGWNPQDQTDLRGSEKTLVVWAEHFAKNNDVTIYLNGFVGNYNGVKYRGFKDFNPFDHSDIFISFKMFPVLEQYINADKKIHWSHEVESIKPYQLEGIDYFVVLSEYHKSRILDHDKIVVIGNPVDFKELSVNKQQAGIYCSSYDRGLETLLKDWDDVKTQYSLEKLYITYGWDMFDKINAGNKDAMKWKMYMSKLMEQKGIEYLGALDNDKQNELLASCKYWFLPLNNPDSELFCISGVEAQYYETIPVIKKRGALQNSILNHVEYYGGDLNETQIRENYDWSLNFSKDVILKQWEKLLS